MNEPKILVTGAGSFVGGHIIRHLADAAIPVASMYRTWCPELEALQQRPTVQLVRVDLTDVEALRALDLRPACILHVAASGPGRAPEDLVRDNVLATLNILEFAQRNHCPKLIHLSSVSVHGDVVTDPVDEFTDIRNPGDYGLTKRAAEVVLSGAGEGPAVVALRLPAVLGRGARSHWLARVVNSALTNRDIEVWNPTAKFNNVVHVSDLARFIQDLVSRDWRPSSPFPLASEDPVTIAQIAATVVSLTASRSRVLVRTPHSRPFTISDRFARINFGYTSMSTMEAITRYVRESQ